MRMTPYDVLLSTFRASILCLISLVGSFSFQKVSAQTVATVELYTVSPSSYSHLYGGGELGEALEEGGFQGSRTSLAASQFTCGDYVSTFVVIHGEAGASQEEVSIRFALELKPSIARGASLVLVDAPILHQGEERFTPQGTLEWIADPAYSASEESEVTVREQAFVPPLVDQDPLQIFNADYEVLTFAVTGIDEDEQIVVRLDLEIRCASHARPRGTLKGTLASASSTNGGEVAIGTSEVSLQGIENLRELTAPQPKVLITPTNDRNVCPSFYEARRHPVRFEPFRVMTLGEELEVPYCVLATNTGSMPLLNSELSELEPESNILSSLEQLNPYQELKVQKILSLTQSTSVSIQFTGMNSSTGEQITQHISQFFSLITPGDADGDGLSDREELTYGTDLFSFDSDEDGLNDFEEVQLGSDPLDADCDDDGLIDGFEGSIEAIYNYDTDGDGLFDGTERGITEPHPDTDLSQGHFIPDLDPTTRSNHMLVDSDGGGCPDNEEDPNLNGRLDPGESDLLSEEDDLDRDHDGLCDVRERSLGSDPEDGDSDDDGLNDGQEPFPELDRDGDGLNTINDPDSDNDGLGDGLELGLTQPDPDTDIDAGHFTPDTDPNTTTDPLLADSDGGGIHDGEEDQDGDGAVDLDETDPNQAHDDEEDQDGDGIPPRFDNCPDIENPDQADLDQDGIGDLCDEDVDGDLVFDGLTPQRMQGCSGGHSTHVTPCILLLLIMFLGLRKRNQQIPISHLTSYGLWIVILLGDSRSAQALPFVEERGFGLDTLQIDGAPHASPGAMSALAPRGVWGGQINGNWSNQAIVLSQEKTTEEFQKIANLIDLRSEAQVSLWIKLNEHWLLTGALPFVIGQGRSDFSDRDSTSIFNEPLSQLPSQALGDLQFSARRYFVSTASLKFAFGLKTSLPTSSADAYAGERSATYGAFSALTYSKGSAQFDASIQHSLRPIVTFIGHQRQDLSQGSLGASWLFKPAYSHLRTGLSVVGQSDMLSRENLRGGTHHALWSLGYLSYQRGRTGAQLWGANSLFKGLSTPEWMFGLNLSIRFKKAPWSSLFEEGGLFGKDATVQPIVKENVSSEVKPNTEETQKELDSDGDHILDEIDLCPHQAGTLLTEGCPSRDMDGDQVVNQEDACPWTAGSILNLGCPVGELAIPFKLRKPFIFDFEKVSLTQAQSKEQVRLTQLAAFIRSKSDLLVHLSGHTDYQGQKGWNKKISYQRVLYIKKALIRAGVNPDQIRTSAFGEEEPLVYDSLHTQRVLNRRVSVTYRLRDLRDEEVNSMKEVQ